MTEPTKGIARPAEQGKVTVPLVGPLNDLDQAYRYAQALAQSNLLPKDLYGKPANVLTIILYGQQLGLTPMQAIQSIYVVNGRPQMSGQLWLSKVREAGHRVKVSDHTDTSCTVTITRGDTGEEHTETFTWADAEKAKLARKDTYQQHPKRMLLWRAVSNCATVICPEVALGFGNEEPEPVTERPTLAQVAAERMDQTAAAEPEPHPDPEPEPENLAEPDAEMVAELAELEREHTVEASPLRDDDPDLFAGGDDE
ncbi:MAG: hypothetical protein QJR12_17015 [Mycobacterium sp.]|uniref:hypothetical protein n=1 Tax=Mycobacterium sp. TaxID=1785 RepID=UPI00262B18CD|nr:hypothetical protein [Mycobacterium sp.]MDI3315909.1 hypothetical protein [Mycobacterium sp.]